MLLNVKALFASCPVSLSHKVFTQNFIATLDRTTTIIDGTPQIHCSDLELLPCDRTSVTRSCHGLAPLRWKCVCPRQSLASPKTLSSRARHDRHKAKYCVCCSHCACQLLPRSPRFGSGRELAPRACQPYRAWAPPTCQSPPR
jgi:hypothetical protein